MSKDDMINQLLRDIELDRFRVLGPVSVDSALLNKAIEAEWSRLNALSHGEVEALYFESEELYAISA